MNAIQEIESGNFSVPRWNLFSPDSVRVVSWNIDRGSKLRRVIEFLAGEKADIVLLQEAGDELRFRPRVSGTDTRHEDFPGLPRPSNTFALAFIEFPHHPIPEAITFLAPTLVSSRNPALSGEAWRAPGTGQRRQYCGQNSRYLQRASGE